MYKKIHLQKKLKINKRITKIIFESDVWGGEIKALLNWRSERLESNNEREMHKWYCLVCGRSTMCGAPIFFFFFAFAGVFRGSESREQ